MAERNRSEFVPGHPEGSSLEHREVRPGMRAGKRGQGWASAAAEKVGEARTALGEGVESLAGKIRETAPQAGMLGSAARGVADRLESAGCYLRRHDFNDMGRDLTNLMRRYPVPTLLVGLGVGFLLSRAKRS
jgi:hypothetical protein